MTAISHDKLLELGFIFQAAKRSYKIEIGGSAFGVVESGPRWLFSPLPMEHVSLVTVNSLEELGDLVFAQTGVRPGAGQTA